MKIIILGAGQVGKTAAHHLAREEANEVTVIDQNEELLRDLQDRLDIRTVVGNAAYPGTLSAAGAKDADVIIALTNSDEVNMVACQVVWKLFNKDATRIARIRSGDYIKHSGLFTDEDRAFAVDVTISPEQLVTEHVARLIRYPGALQVLDFADGRVRLVGTRALKGGLLVGQNLSALREHIPGTDARVAAIYRGGQSIKPEGKTVIEHGDEVFFLAARKDIRLVMNEMQRLEDPVRRVVIAGGGHIGFRLAQLLEKEQDPSDGLPARQLRRPCNAVCLPTCHWQASSTRRPCGAPASSGQQLNPVQLLPTGSVTGAKNGCSRGNQQWWFHCTNREWCPGSLVVLDALRRAGRTETLTGHASHQGHRIRHGNWRNESRRESESGDRSRLEWNRGRHSAPRWQTRCTLPPCCAATTWPGYAARGFSGITSAPWRSLSR